MNKKQVSKNIWLIIAIATIMVSVIGSLVYVMYQNGMFSGLDLISDSTATQVGIWSIESDNPASFMTGSGTINYSDPNTGTWHNVWGEWRGLVQFPNMLTSMEGKTITSVKLKLFVSGKGWSNYTSEDSITYRISQALQTWDRTVTWNTKPVIDLTKGVDVSYPFASSLWWEIDVTNDALWMKTNNVNHGWVIRELNKLPLQTQNVTYRWVAFSTAKLDITYSIQPVCNVHFQTFPVSEHIWIVIKGGEWQLKVPFDSIVPFNCSQVLTLEVPLTYGQFTFDHWTFDGINGGNSNTTQWTVPNRGTSSVMAIYRNGSIPWSIITISVSPEASGIVSPLTTGVHSDMYQQGQDINFSVTPAKGFTFVHFTRNGVNFTDLNVENLGATENIRFIFQEEWTFLGLTIQQLLIYGGIGVTVIIVMAVTLVKKGSRTSNQTQTTRRIRL